MAETVSLVSCALGWLVGVSGLGFSGTGLQVKAEKVEFGIASLIQGFPEPS